MIWYHGVKEVEIMELAKQIKRYRKKEKYSQTDLATKLFVSRQAISNWERGLSEPDLETVQKLADIFHTSIEELITGDEVEDRQLQMQKKINWLFMIGFISSVVCFIITIIKPQSNTALVMPFIITFMIGIVIVIFGYAIRNREYSMIAGYDDERQYNEQVLRRMLLMIQLSMVIVYNFTMILCVAALWFQLRDLTIICMIINVINVFISVLGCNIRYQHTLFREEKQQKNAVQSSILVILYVFVLLLSVSAVTYTFWLHDIHNNTPQALMVLGFMSPGLIYHTICLFYVDHTLKQGKKISVVFWCVSAILTIIWLMIIVCFPYE